MKYALLNGIKSQAVISAERGVCIYCGKETIAHCGEFKINHWQHKTLKECDNWYEPETEWHRAWKNNFPVSFQEIVMFDNQTNEKHIADIYNSEKDVVIEIQHSPISNKEVQSRESFYKKLIWVIDLIPYKKNITLNSDILDSFYYSVIMPWAKKQDSLIKKLEEEQKYDLRDKLKMDNTGDNYIIDFEKKYSKNNSKQDYYLMEWKYQHKRWTLTNSPMFFDLGDEYMYMKIEAIKIWSGFIVKRFTKNEFIQKYK